MLTTLLRPIAMTVLVASSASATAERPPHDVLVQMNIVSQVDAALTLCENSAEFQRLSRQTVSKLYDRRRKIDDLMKLVETKYSDDLAYLAMKVQSADYAEDPAFQRKMAGMYSRQCAPQLLTDASAVLSAAETAIRRAKK